MKNLIKITKFALYILLPLCFFAILYTGVCFVFWEWNPATLTASQRFFIVWFGLISSSLGILLAIKINKQKY